MKNRWLIAASAVGIHLSIGTVYAYSVLKLPLFDAYGWQVTTAFSTAIVFLGLSAAFMGHFVEKYGPRAAGIFAGSFFGVGTIGAGVVCWLAAGALQPTLDQPISSPAVSESIAAVSTDLKAYRDDPDNGYKPGDANYIALTNGMAHTTSLTAKDGNVQSLLDQVKTEYKQTKEAKGVAEAGEKETAAANAKVAEMIKKGVVTKIIAPESGFYQWAFLLFYGVLGGIGLGVGYITPVSTLVKWFPDRRGLATGLAIMGFGFGAFAFAFVMNYMIETYSPAIMFMALGALYMVMMLSSALYLAPPPKDWKPAGWDPDAIAAKKGKAKAKGDLSQLMANEAIKTPRFYFLWLMLFINVTCGIALLSVASPMAQDMVGMTAAAGAGLVMAMGLLNGAGRIGWASVSDFIGRPNTYLVFFILQFFAFVLLPMSVSFTPFFVFLVLLIITCYGGGFASIPAFIGDMFGTKQLGAIHGYILTAWAAAGVVGPMTAGYVREITGSYDYTLYIFSGLFIVAAIIAIMTKINIAQIRKKNAADQQPMADNANFDNAPAAKPA